MRAELVLICVVVESIALISRKDFVGLEARVPKPVQIQIVLSNDLLLLQYY